jgi:flagellin-like protein
MMRRKGLSPIVAVVILIGIAVVTGGLLSSWITSFVSDSAKQDTCAISTMYTLSDVTYNTTSGEVKLKVKNTGNVKLYNFTVEADNGTIIFLSQATSPEPSYRVDTGRVQYVVANFSLANISNVHTITVLTQSCKGYSPAHTEVENI